MPAGINRLLDNQQIVLLPDFLGETCKRNGMGIPILFCIFRQIHPFLNSPWISKFYTLMFHVALFGHLLIFCFAICFSNDLPVLNFLSSAVLCFIISCSIVSAACIRCVSLCKWARAFGEEEERKKSGKEVPQEEERMEEVSREKLRLLSLDSFCEQDRHQCQTHAPSLPPGQHKHWSYAYAPPCNW